MDGPPGVNHRKVTVTNRPRVITIALSTLIPLWGLGIIASRLTRLAAHPPLIDIAALLISVTLAIVALYEAFRGRKKRAVWLFAIEACLQLFVLTTVDIPWARGDGGHAVTAVVLRVDAWNMDRTGDHVGAAWERVIASGGTRMMTYSAESAPQVIQQHACGALRNGYDLWIKNEPALHEAFARKLGACAAADGNTNEAIAEYTYLVSSEFNKPSMLIAANLAAIDGFPDLAILTLNRALTSGERANTCRSIDFAYNDTRKPSHLSIAIRAAHLARCTAT